MRRLHRQVARNPRFLVKVNRDVVYRGNLCELAVLEIEYNYVLWRVWILSTEHLRDGMDKNHAYDERPRAANLLMLHFKLRGG